MDPTDPSASVTGKAAALLQAQAEAKNQPDEDFDEGFLDFASHYREQFKAGAPSGFGTSPLLEKETPPRFEDVSLCVDCRHCHSVTIPVNVRVPTGESGQRAALGKIRRCLLGLQLTSKDDPELLTSVRQNARMAPLAVDCTHFDPWTDDELTGRETRRMLHVERMRQRREAEAALDAEDVSSTPTTDPEKHAPEAPQEIP